MAPPSVKKRGIIAELLAEPDEVVFANLAAKLTSTYENFIPIKVAQSCLNGAFVDKEDAAKIFNNPKVDRVTALLEAVKGGGEFPLKTVEFAQRRAELKIHKDGKIVVTRKLRVWKRDDPEEVAVLLICPGMGGMVLEYTSQQFHDSEDFKHVGDYLEKVDEEEMGSEEFSEFMDAWRAKGK